MPFGDKPRRPAQQAPRFRLHREAVDLAKPFTKKLGSWQVRIARLRGLGQQLSRLTADERTSCKAEALALRDEIDAARQAFEALVTAAAADLRTNDVLDDVTKALGNAFAAIDETVTLHCR